MKTVKEISDNLNQAGNLDSLKKMYNDTLKEAATKQNFTFAELLVITKAYEEKRKSFATEKSQLGKLNLFTEKNETEKTASRHATSGLDSLPQSPTNERQPLLRPYQQDEETDSGCCLKF